MIPERLRICKDDNCPECDWPETWMEANLENPLDGDIEFGCNKCDWRELRAAPVAVPKTQ